MSADHSNDSPRDYYVTVRDGGRVGWLLGPYPAHEEALAKVDAGKRLALAASRWAWFYAYGTASVPAGTPVRTTFAEGEAAHA